MVHETAGDTLSRRLRELAPLTYAVVMCCVGLARIALAMWAWRTPK